ncbi:MAG: carboxypeptidase regulatory-like domain-containing protein, partial [Myxococcaceae bacterium]|nr:carboxypeptidase regulatory-like domain-containing protein [Myxococcaceae bacterium]
MSNVTGSTATLNWPEATDDVGVTEYVLTRNGTEVTRGLSRTLSVTGLVPGDFAAFRVVARDADGNESDALRAFVPGAQDVIVPTSDVSISTDFCAAMQFLFTGATPLQRDVDPSRLSCTTLAAVHGRVRSPGGSPIPGVAVSVVGKPEFGSTVTRADGAFDLAVTAGEHVVQLTTPVFLPVHRRVVATRARLTTLEDDVVLVPTDEKATTVELPAGGLHTATVREDASGRRQVRLFIPAGTTAVAELRDGGTQALPRVTVRVTEYTVGRSGPNAMPAQLPESSAYTFAAEFTVDEAVALGATGVRFSAPVATWVDNFLGSPLCTQVPQGRYDAQLMRWVSEPASLVVATAPGGLDVTGDGVADSDGRLLPGEAEALAATFPTGTSLVRTLSTHFSPRDDNYPWRCDGTCQGSTRKVPDKCPRGCTQRGSIIDCHNQTVSEAWAVPGTGLSLELHSHRQPAGSFRLEVPLGTDVDGGVRGALAGRIVLDIAGQRLVAEVPDAGEGTTVSVDWNGKDALGRVVRGPVEGTLQAGFRFGRQNVSAVPAGGVCTGDLLRFGATASSFGNVPVDGAPATGPARDSRYFANSQPVLLGTWVGAEELGGFSLGILHGSSASTGTLFMGNGLFMREADVGATARLYAGGGRTRMDSLPARDAQLNQVAHLVAGPDGSLYFVDNGTTIRRVTPDGARVETVAGTVGAGAGFSGDGAPARAARFSGIDGLAVAPNGDVYIADTSNQRIRRVEASTGVVTTVAGTGSTGVPTAGAQALQSPLNSPRTMAWGSDNKLYFFTYTGTGNGDVLFRLADGVLERIGGGAPTSPPPPTESDSAHRVSFSTFGKRMAQGPDGSLYITDNRARVRRLTPSGRVELVAGEGRQTQDGERGVATQFGDAMGVAVDSLGVVYVADRGGAPGRRGGSIRAVGGDGRVTTVAGTGELPTTGRGPDIDKPGTAINLGESREVAVLPDGRVAYAEGFFGTIQVLQRAWDLSLGERGVGSEDGNQVYVFDASGRHLRTLETLTGTPIWRFGWDASGRLASVTDRNGDVTTVLRDAQGRFSGLRAQDGQVTQATLDTQGRVTALTDAANRTVRIAWNSRGQPATWEDEERGLTRFEYDDNGRLVSETDANGGVKTVGRDETKSGYTVSYRSPEGRLTRYEVSESGRFRLYTNTFPDGLQTVSRASGGRETTFFPDGTVVDEFLASDTRFGSQSPYRSFQQTRMPSGLTLGVGTSRKVTLDGGAVLALAQLEETTSLNTNTWTRTYTANDRTWRMTSPVGRVTTVTLDEKGRPLTWTTPGVLPTQVTYDARGRP